MLFIKPHLNKKYKCHISIANLCIRSVAAHPCQERLLTASMALAMLAMAVCAVVTHSGVEFTAFLALEVAIGLYFPAIGSLRSQVWGVKAGGFIFATCKYKNILYSCAPHTVQAGIMSVP